MEIKDKQINLRVSKGDRDKIKNLAKQNNYKSISEYLVQAGLGRILDSGNSKNRVYTLTLNPAVDYIIKTDNKLEEITNFLPEEKVFEAGGKGINASIILEELSVNNTAIHASGGFSGDIIVKQLHEKGIHNIQVKTPYDTRINLKLNFNKESYEINAKASALTARNKNDIHNLTANFNKGDVLMIMGSYHSSDDSFLIELSELCVEKGVELVYDISTPLIKDLIKYKPLIVKPNNDELEMIFGKKVKTEKQIIDHMKELKALGAKNVAVTMGGDGAFLLDKKNNLYKATVDPIRLESPQGSGDSFISTFVALHENGIKEAFTYANAAGAATASVKGLATKELIEAMVSKIHITKV